METLLLCAAGGRGQDPADNGTSTSVQFYAGFVVRFPVSDGANSIGFTDERVLARDWHLEDGPEASPPSFEDV